MGCSQAMEEACTAGKNYHSEKRSSHVGYHFTIFNVEGCSPEGSGARHRRSLHSTRFSDSLRLRCATARDLDVGWLAKRLIHHAVSFGKTDQSLDLFIRCPRIQVKT